MPIEIFLISIVAAKEKINNWRSGGAINTIRPLGSLNKVNISLMTRAKTLVVGDNFAINQAFFWFYAR